MKKEKDPSPKQTIPDFELPIFQKKSASQKKSSPEKEIVSQSLNQSLKPLLEITEESSKKASQMLKSSHWDLEDEDIFSDFNKKDESLIPTSGIVIHIKLVLMQQQGKKQLVKRQKK